MQYSVRAALHSKSSKLSSLCQLFAANIKSIYTTAMTCLRPHTVSHNVERFNALLEAQVWECGRSMAFLAGHRAWQLSYLAEVLTKVLSTFSC